MSNGKREKGIREQRANLLDMQKRLQHLRADRRGDDRNYSLEGLKLASVLSQLQALQAIQGLKELRPKSAGQKGRYQFSNDAGERSTQRQWLAFKADWLEALLEDALSELEALDAYEKELKEGKSAAKAERK